MKLNTLSTSGGAFCVLVTTVLLALNSKAESIIYQFQPLFASSSVVSQMPQVVADFQDISPGKVALIINTANLGGAFLSDLYLNFDPADKIDPLHFNSLFNSGRPFLNVSTGKNSFTLGNYGCYDIHFAFSETCLYKSSNRNYVIYEISEPGLDASDFAFVSAGGTIPCFTVADIRGPGGNCQWLGCSSVRLRPVPEPVFIGFAALTLGAGCLCVWRRRKC